MKKMMLWKITVIVLIFLNSGCTTAPEKQETGKLKFPDKSEPIKWVSVGTLVSVGPDTEPTRHPDQLRSAILGETKFSRTRVETTEGVYIVGDKIGLVETGIPVSVGYDPSDEYPNTPSYLAFGGKRYKIVR
ncbi:MAG: hypothetical protein ACYTEQ_08855 [Planctomycetota bacterium]|jgi:hypothetical protein